MSRSLNGSFASALVSSHIRPRFLFEATFGGTTYYWCTGSHDISYNGNLYLGNGYLQTPALVDEDIEMSATTNSIALTGEPSVLMSIIFGSAAHTNTGKMYFALVNEDLTIIGTPHEMFSGKLDVVEILDDPNTATIKISYENKLIELDKQKELRYTDECQKTYYPTDKGFIYMQQTADWKGYWGKSQRAKKDKKGKGRK